MQYLAGVGATLPVGVARAENPFIAAMEAAVDEEILDSKVQKTELLIIISQVNLELNAGSDSI